MGLAIGSIGRNLPASVSYAPSVKGGAARPRSFSAGPAPEGVNPLRTQAPSPFAEAAQPKQKPPQAGFGSGTVSPPGAALEALGRGVRSVRESLPTLAERRDEIRERFDGLRELQREKGRSVEDPQAPPERVEAQPTAAAPGPLESAGARARAEQARNAQRGETEPNGGFVLRRAEEAQPPQFVDVRV